MFCIAMSKKKGQIFAEPFFWILALITAALVLTFGYMAVKRLNDTFDKTSIAKWSTNFKKVVDEVITWIQEAASQLQ